MADIIQLLPDSVANQIAAGEVILRPASAVKEMMENSIDSGATEIELIIKDAGRTLIQVVDNGCGMTARDARTCFERHATSKIREAGDLFAIRTLGFRGEALASIAAVAQVELRTRPHEEDLGTMIEVEGSRFKSQSSCSCQAGTSVQVKNLFFNVPARRKFLKSDHAELKHIIDEFFRIGIIYNQVRFTYYQDGKMIYQLLPSTRKQRIVALFGSNYNERLVPVDEATEDVKVSGFIGKPEFARKTRGEQYFFVNGRYIRHAYLNHALESAYRELIPSDSIPSYFIFIEVDPKEIDVNIHPTKTEVNFVDNKLIYGILKSSVRKGLGIHNLTPSIDFDVEQSLDFSPEKEGRAVKNPFDREPTGYNPFEKELRIPGHIKGKKGPDQSWESLIDLRNVEITKNEEPPGLIDSSWDEEQTEVKNNVFQLLNQYIVTSIKSGLVIIHQERARERVLYERFYRQLDTKQATSQQELFPEQVSFSLSDAELLTEMLDELNILGIGLNKLGVNTFVVTGTPADLKDRDLQKLLEEMLNNYKMNLVNLDVDIKVNLARSMSTSLRIPAGKKLHYEEMVHLIDELFSCSAPEWTPDGKKVFTVVSADTINILLDKSKQ